MSDFAIVANEGSRCEMRQTKTGADIADNVPVPAVEPRSPRIPSLDGYRALSILMVVFHHSMRTAGFPSELATALKYGINGNLGVRFFFVISGFLITSLLLKEEERQGTVSLQLFYERRAARILPVYWTYILAVLLYSMLGGGWLAPRPYLEAVTFTLPGSTLINGSSNRPGPYRLRRSFISFGRCCSNF